MPSVGFEPTVSAGEGPQTFDLERATTGTGPTTFTDLKQIGNSPLKSFPAVNTLGNALHSSKKKFGYVHVTTEQTAWL
jgi:hypothetical protein